MAVSDSVSKGGIGGGVGLQLGVIRAELVKSLFRLSLGALVFQLLVETRLVDRKLSQTLLIALPGPVGRSCVAVKTSPDFLVR